nr:hypothetical protein [Tanacetum cinerariifolium]
MYGDVNIRLTDAEHNDKEKGDAKMTDVAYVHFEQTQEQTTSVQEESGPEMESTQVQYVVQATITDTSAIQNATNEEESGPEMESTQVQYVVQATITDTSAIQNATNEVPPLNSSHSVSSTYTNAFLNLKNLHSTKTEVVSMLDINVQHEILRTSSLFTILLGLNVILILFCIGDA